MGISMRNTLVAQRYSKALLDLAIENNQLESVMKDIEFIRASMTRELRNALASPAVREDKKTQIFNAIFKGKLTPLTFSFFNLVFTKGRELVLPEIAEAFISEYRKLKGIELIELTTAVEVSEEMKEFIRSRFQSLERFKDKKIELKSKVNSNILGGFIAKFEDLLYDASIKRDLQYIGTQFIENMYVQKIR